MISSVAILAQGVGGWVPLVGASLRPGHTSRPALLPWACFGRVRCQVAHVKFVVFQFFRTRGVCLLLGLSLNDLVVRLALCSGPPLVLSCQVLVCALHSADDLSPRCAFVCAFENKCRVV